MRELIFPVFYMGLFLFLYWLLNGYKTTVEKYDETVEKYGKMVKRYHEAVKKLEILQRENYELHMSLAEQHKCIMRSLMDSDEFQKEGGHI